MASQSKYGYEEAAEAADYIRTRINRSPRVAVMTGTGLGDMLASMQADAVIDYREIPHFPVSTVQTHYGRLAAGTLDGQSVVLLQGRLHLYEGYYPVEVVFPVRVLQALGIETFILTNASGGLDPDFKTGQIMIIQDHINLTGANPLAGPNDERWGPRFPQMTEAYSRRLGELARSAARHLKIDARLGVYAGLRGPSLETPAEMRFLRTIGAQAVGFSTVMENIAAVHAGMAVLGLSVVTNMCLPDDLTTANVEEIIAVAQAAAPDLDALISHVIGQMDQVSG